MQKWKPAIHVECCCHCHEHLQLQHSEAEFKHALVQLETELRRSWPNASILVNHKKTVSRLNSFEIVSNGILLYSRLRQGGFADPRDVSTMLLCLARRSAVQRNLLRMRLSRQSLFQFLIASGRKKVLLSLKCANELIERLLTGGQENPRPQSHINKTIHPPKKEQQEGKGGIENVRNTEPPHQSKRAKQPPLRGTSINENANVKMSSKNYLPFKVGRKPSCHASIRKPKKCSYLSKDMDVSPQHSPLRSRITLLQLSSEEEVEHHLIADDPLERRKKEGFSTTLQAKEIGEGETRKFSFQFKKFTDDIEDKIKEEFSRVNNKKSEFANEDHYSSKQLSNQSAQFSERNSEESKEDLSFQTERHQQLSSTPHLEEPSILARSQKIASPASSASSTSQILESSDSDKTEIKDEVCMFQVTCSLLEENDQLLQMIAWYCSSNRHIASHIFNGEAYEDLNIFSSACEICLNLFDPDIGVFKTVRVSLIQDHKRSGHPDWAIAVMGGILRDRKSIALETAIKIMTGVPMIRINASESNKVEKVLLQNYWSKENRIGQVLCIPSAMTVGASVRAMQGYELHGDNLTVLLAQDQQLSYSAFRSMYDGFLILFEDSSFQHSQLRCEFHCEDSEFLNPSWKILFENPAAATLFLEFTCFPNLGRPASISIAKVGRAGAEPVSKRTLWKRTSVVGQISRKGSFFFELELEAGLYCCEIARQFNREEQNSVHWYSSQVITVIRDCLDYQTAPQFLESSLMQ